VIPGHVPAFVSVTARDEELSGGGRLRGQIISAEAGCSRGARKRPWIRWIPPEDIAAAALLTVDQALALLPACVH
jgi:hypothetical protein